jgi:hypothetical protein
VTNDPDLASLRWHYSGAYVVNHPAADVWIAQRTDDNTTLRASTPDGLLDLIRVDYGERPVPRVRAALRVAQAARRWT